MLRPRAVVPSFIVALVALVAPDAAADVKVNAGVLTGPAMTDLRGSKPHFAGALGLRGDAIFLRKRDADMGLGPYVDVTSIAFDTVEPGGGLSWVIPLGDPVLMVSGGGQARISKLGVEPGVSSTLFFGGRVHNFHSWYNLTGGAFAQTRLGLGESKAWEVLVGAQLDLVYLAIPFIYAYEAARVSRPAP